MNLVAISLHGLVAIISTPGMHLKSIKSKRLLFKRNFAMIKKDFALIAKSTCSKFHQQFKTVIAPLNQSLYLISE